MKIFSIDHHPLDIFNAWYHEATQLKNIDPTAAALGTATKDGQVSVRMVLIKEANQEGFVFFTNLNSKKGLMIRDNPRAALCFYWTELGKQIRIEGALQQISDKEADNYFKTRPRLSQIGAWASEQSQPMQYRDQLKEKLEHFERKFKDQMVPRPPHWSGYRLLPDYIEFWSQKDFRLHERIAFHQSDSKWVGQYLYP